MFESIHSFNNLSTLHLYTMPLNTFMYTSSGWVPWFNSEEEHSCNWQVMPIAEKLCTLAPKTISGHSSVTILRPATIGIGI